MLPRDEQMFAQKRGDDRPRAANLRQLGLAESRGREVREGGVCEVEVWSQNECLA